MKILILFIVLIVILSTKCGSFKDCVYATATVLSTKEEHCARDESIFFIKILTI